jgi:hypothetical protein
MVVDKTGKHITLFRSLVRFAIFGAPWFLNGISVPFHVLPFPIGYLIGFLIFGFGGAIIYLFIFNRHTRQSLHDLLVKTFVVKTSSNGDIAPSPVWKLHFIIVGVWFFIVISAGIFSSIASRKNVFPELIAIQKSIQSTGKVHTATAFVGKSWGISNGKKWESTYFLSTVTWKTRPIDFEVAASEIASMVLSEYPEVVNKDFLAIKVIYGYDLGIARAWKTYNIHVSPQEWRRKLSGPLPTEQTID